MPVKKFEKTAYPGVKFYTTEQGEKIYYIRYRSKKIGRQIEECVGGKAHAMTAAKAYQELLRRKAGAELTNEEKRLEKQKKTDCWTLKKLFNAYQETLEPGGGRKTDLKSFKKWSEYYDRELDEITTQDIEKVKKSLIKRGLSQETVRHAVVIVSRTINYGVKAGLITAPDSKKLFIDKVKVDKKLEIETMSDEELSRYLGALDEEPDQLSAQVFRFALFTGMRKTAILQLQWKDVDFINNFIKLRGLVAKSGNTGTIKMNDIVKEILIFMKENGNSETYVFAKEDGTPRQDMRRMGCRVKRKAGLPADFRPFHGLRHTFASRAISNGVSLTDLQQLLTHKSPSMTQIYAHFSDEALQKAADAAGKAKQVNGK